MMTIFVWVVSGRWKKSNNGVKRMSMSATSFCNRQGNGEMARQWVRINQCIPTADGFGQRSFLGL
jgi:hypothetical protein